MHTNSMHNVMQCCPDNMKNQVLGVITDLSENPKVCFNFLCAHVHVYYGFISACMLHN